MDKLRRIKANTRPNKTIAREKAQWRKKRQELKDDAPALPRVFEGEMDAADLPASVEAR